MYATARIESGHATETVLVPRDAVTTRDGARVVYRVADNVVTAAPVVEGLTDEGRVQILKGLAAGEAIVADARKALVSSTKVRAIPAIRARAQ